MEDKIRGVYFDENSDGVPKIGFTTSKDTYIVTFGEALEWWRQSDQAYRRHPLQLSLGRKADRGGTVSDLNTIEGTGFFVGWNNPNAAPTNVSGAHWYVIQSQFDSDWKMQLATSLGGGEIYMRIKNSGAWQSWRAIQLSLGRFNVHGTAKRFEAYGYTAPDDGRRVFQLVFMDEARKVLGYIEASKKGVTYTDAQLSLDRVSLYGIDAVAFNDNAGDVELWMYTDAAQRNGIVVGISPTAIQLYKIKNGDTTPTKRFE